MPSPLAVSTPAVELLVFECTGPSKRGASSGPRGIELVELTIWTYCERWAYPDTERLAAILLDAK